MIEDLEGATVEPTRRRHVAVLSSAVAAVSFALFVALIVPPSRDTPASSPVPSPNTQHLMIVSNPLNQTRLDLTLDSVCPDGTRLIPPYALVYDASGGQIHAVRYVVGGVAHSVPVSVVADKRTPYLTVACGTSDRVPWTDR